MTVITSVTCKRNKRFTTPVGVFTYQYLHSHKYAVGITRHHVDEHHPVLIVTPEKALADHLALAAPQCDTLPALDAYLRDSLRCDMALVRRLSAARMRDIARAYHHPVVALLARYVGRKAAR